MVHSNQENFLDKLLREIIKGIEEQSQNEGKVVAYYDGDIEPRNQEIKYIKLHVDFYRRGSQDFLANVSIRYKFKNARRYKTYEVQYSSSQEILELENMLDENMDLSLLEKFNILTKLLNLFNELMPYEKDDEEEDKE